jgi:peptidoglycan/xylan/chitin deacetylase (PgdA/CDA1 family)
MKVLLTIDTECYPLRGGLGSGSLEEDLRRDVYGETPEGAVGLSFQLGILKRHGLKGTFFVESLFTERAGRPALTRVVDEIVSGGSEVQLHVHPEWLDWVPDAPVPGRGRGTLREFLLEEQRQIIARGLRNLREAGVEPTAFRAGDFAADRNTLRALGQLGIGFDTSCSAVWAESYPDVPELARRWTPLALEGVWEVPVSCWVTAFGGVRPAQICATSAAELRAALQKASRAGWRTFVVVSHSFELLRHPQASIDRPAVDRLVVRRFLELCRFLDENRREFPACGFADLEARDLESPEPAVTLHPPARHTVGRWVEQAYRRLP